MSTVVRRDMALLENQMPFFVVQRLFEMAFKTHRPPMLELLELVWSFFGPIIWKKNLPKLVMESEVKHFVHAISLSFWPSVREVPNERSKEMKFSPSATELVAAGVKLRRGESKCLLDIEFENGVLDIPCLIPDELKESYFRNIIAFEQFYWENKYLTEYFAFMEHLVESPGDADLLINKAIIENWLSNKEAAVRKINTISREALLSSNYHFHSLCDKLNKHCQRHYNKWKATFKRDYCSNPWVVISVIGAVVLLLLTVAQTVLSALSLK
ncbi:hypothetical protein BT93_C1580 [Corymbia citriodora subsp. variegata]|nr:hypothetical protein BT93_C1580 [Corymbia citriodora subsp. variegata]